MNTLRNVILSYMKIPVSLKGNYIPKDLSGRYTLKQLMRACSTSASVDPNQVLDQVVSLVKKFDKIDAAMVTETADFQKDLSLDSLDRVELVMAFEEEFSIEIPDAEADKLKSCADVAKYVISAVSSKVSESS